MQKKSPKKTAPNGTPENTCCGCIKREEDLQDAPIHNGGRNVRSQVRRVIYGTFAEEKTVKMPVLPEKIPRGLARDEPTVRSHHFFIRIKLNKKRKI